MYKKVFCALMAFGFIITLAYGQEIQWTNVTSWNRLFKTAKEENKPVFVDCFATWCAPCQRMDKEVFSDPAVAKFMNANFICIKLQMDQTEIDDSLTKTWYKRAEIVRSDFSVTAYPSYLIFSPDQKPMHRFTGYLKATEFLAAAGNALNPKKQYYTLLENFQPGVIDTSELKSLAKIFSNSNKGLSAKMILDYVSRIPIGQRRFPDNLDLIAWYSQENAALKKLLIDYFSGLSKDEFILEGNLYSLNIAKNEEAVKQKALQIMKGYTTLQLKSKQRFALLKIFKEDSAVQKIAENYFKRLSEAELLTKENIERIQLFTTTSKSFGFQFFYTQSAKVDPIMKSAFPFASGVVSNVIMKDEIMPYLNGILAKMKSLSLSPMHPNWDSVAAIIAKKYGAYYSKKNVASAKFNYYSYMYKTAKAFLKESNEAAVASWELTCAEGNCESAWFGLNNTCWEIFKTCDDKVLLKRAAKLMEVLLNSQNPEHQVTLFDTYACLLYKAGESGKAIEWEEKVVDVAQKNNMPGVAIRQGKILDRMKKGEEIWVDAD